MGLIVFLTGVLVVSVTGIVTLISLKRHEMITGRVIFGETRPAVGAFFHRVLVWFERLLPALIARACEQLVVCGRWLIHRGIAHGIIIAERLLERGLRTLRHTTEPPQNGRKASSTFLREIVAHKRRITKRASTSRQDSSSVVRPPA